VANVHGDARFDADERRDVERAAEAWRRMTRGRVDFRIYWDRGPLHDGYREIVPVSYLDLHGSTGEPACGGVRGGVLMLVRDPYRCRPLYPIVLHELGHFAGIEHHVDRPGAVMHWEGPNAWTLTAADEWLCEKEGVCAP
jgi:hypothetical protein